MLSFQGAREERYELTEFLLHARVLTAHVVLPVMRLVGVRQLLVVAPGALHVGRVVRRQFLVRGVRQLERVRRSAVQLAGNLGHMVQVSTVLVYSLADKLIGTSALARRVPLSALCADKGR